MTPDQIVSLVRFEEPQGTPNLDDLGALDALFPPAGTLAPTQERGPVGLAAIFSPGAPSALQAKDLAVGGTVLPRDISVQAIMSWDIVAQGTYGHAGDVIARGLGTGATEYMPFAVELYVIDAVNRIGAVRWLWHTTAGALKTEAGALFIVPPPDQFFMLTVTRRWVSLNEVVLRYYVNDQKIGEVVSSDGDIAASVDGTTTIGSRYSGGAYGNFLAGAIDELAISNYEMCLEEIDAEWSRISFYQLDGYRQILDLMPPGMPITDDPQSRVQQELMVLGIALGFADGQIENFRNNIMPDRAYGNILRRWEGITRQPPNQGDSLDIRRARVIGHLASRLGVSVPGVQTALAQPIDDLPAGADLQLFAFDNTIRDSFNTLAPERWAFTEGVDVTGGELRLQAPTSNGLGPWDVSAISGGISALLPVEPSRLHGGPLASVAMFGSLDPHTLPANGDAGLVLWSWSTNSMLFFGLRNVGGSYEVGYQRFRFGAATDGAWVSLATTSLTKHWLRIRPSGSAFIGSQTDEDFDLSWSTTGSTEADFTTHDALTWLRGFQWAGLYYRSTDPTHPVADVRFGNDFALRNGEGTRPFYFYAFRDPMLGGSPDIAGGDRIVQRMKHAFTYARLITSKSLLCDNPGSLTDFGPMGCL